MIPPNAVSNKAMTLTSTPGARYEAPANMTRAQAVKWAQQHVPYYHRRSFLEAYRYAGEKGGNKS